MIKKDKNIVDISRDPDTLKAINLDKINKKGP